MKLRFILFVLLILLPVGSAYGQIADKGMDSEEKFSYKVVVLQHTGPDSNRIKLAYASDGYTLDDLPTFPEHVINSIDYIFSPGMAVRPFPRYRNFINIYRIDLVSKESGISVAPRSGEDKTTIVNNALGGTRDEDRLGWVDRRLAQELFKEAAERINISEFNWPFVVLNNPKYHNSGGRFVVFSYNFGKEIGLHEAGHGFFNLADEYYGKGRYERNEPRNINVTADSTGSKWDHWMGYMDIDTLLGVIDVYEGAIYASEGAFRPSKNSKMGWTSDRKPASFNAVSREKVILDIYDKVNPVDAVMDTSIVHIKPEKIWLEVIDPEVLLVDWYINGELVLENGGQEIKISELISKPGEYKIRAHVYDEIIKYAFNNNNDPHPLDLVRKDLHKLQKWIEWDLVF